MLCGPALILYLLGGNIAEARGRGFAAVPALGLASKPADGRQRRAGGAAGSLRAMWILDTRPLTTTAMGLPVGTSICTTSVRQYQFSFGRTYVRMIDKGSPVEPTRQQHLGGAMAAVSRGESLEPGSRNRHAAFRDLIQRGTTQLGEAELRELLGDLVPFGPARLCQDPRQAGMISKSLTYPVVLKVFSAGLLHKSDHGLVRVGLRSQSEVEDAATHLLSVAAGLALEQPQLSVQTQLTGLELAIGVRRDELGALCMVAAGGTLIELKGDSRAALAPVDLAEARSLIYSLDIAPAFAGYRGSGALDIAAFAQLFSRIADLAIDIPEIAELDLNPVFVNSRGCFVADGAAILAAPATERANEVADVNGFFSPRRIAVVGASKNEAKAGGLIVKYLIKHGFSGEIIAVNQAPTFIEGVTNVTDLEQVDGTIDLACIAVPAPAVPGVIDACIRRNIPRGIIYSAGVDESEIDGTDKEGSLVHSSAAQFRFVGPNSMGIALPAKRMFATFGRAMEASTYEIGPLGFISQSGALASSLFSRAGQMKLGFSHWISVGNETDLGVEDFIAALAVDPACRVICLYIEAIRRPAAFIKAARLAREAGKALIAFKSGASEAGRVAALSHTGAITGQEESYDAFFARAGVIRAHRLDDLFILPHGILQAGPVRGSRVGILSTSGGGCSLIADACAEVGLAVPELGRRAQAGLAEILPSFAGVRNPVDITAMAIWNPVLLRNAINAMIAGSEIDIVLVQLTTNADPGAAAMASDIIRLRDEVSVPIMVGRLGAESLAPKAMSLYEEAGVHVFDWPEQLVAAARGCVEFGRFRWPRDR